MIDEIFNDYSDSLLRCENKILTLTSEDYHYNKMRILHDVINRLYGLDRITSYRYNLWFSKYSDREINIIEHMLQNEELKLLQK